MSETNRFVFQRPFPFCGNQAPAPDEDYYNYQDIDLQYAMNLWWNLQKVDFSTSIADFSVPQDFGTNFPFDTIGGSLVGTDITTPASPLPAISPSTRICYGPSNFWVDFASIFACGKSGGPPAITMNFRIALVGSQWRIYYFFAVEDSDNGVVIVNSENTFGADNPSWTLIDSGMVTIDGVDYDWNAYASPSSMITSASMDMAFSFFTYPAP